MSNIINELFDDLDHGGIGESEIKDRGQTRALISDDKVATADRRIRKSGVLEHIAAWRQHDNPSVGAGGRPTLVSDRAILVGLVLLAGENSPQLVRTLALAFQHRLSDESRELLQLPAGTTQFGDHPVEEKRWYNNTHNALHRMLSLMDPFPQSRYRNLSYTQVDAILKAHDPVRELAMKERLDDFTNSFLRMTFDEQPRRIRRLAPKIDISFDQTYIKPPSKKGFSKKSLPKRIADERAEAALPSAERKPISGPVDVFVG